MNKIVYLQTNEKIAESFHEEFLKQDIEMLIVKSGEEALEIISKEKVLLLLLDINIPDMRFRKLVDKIRAISPQIIINVCVDVLDPLMITKLANRHHVHKIYVAPWDVNEIIDEVKESIEIAIINEQINVREEQINSETNELKNTVESLKNTLKKQQKSYSKFLKLTDCFINAIEESEEELNKEKLAFIKDIYTTILKMQTTGSFDIDEFEDNIRKDVEELKTLAKGISTSVIESCLFAGQSRVYAQNIRFTIYMLARLYAQFYSDFSINVSSHFITTKEAEFVIEIETESSINSRGEDAFRDYYKYVNGIITELSSDVRTRNEGKVTTFYCNFIVAKDTK
ncbi:MAG: hypothetical protein Q4B53_07920 [Lachnospiraceae bacterium]|nr:hypothetical protein [Lachnospiraceae bacterium]